MTLSLLLAWAAVICTVMAALKFIARISKNRTLNRFFRKCHIPFGVLLLVFGILHGILAGNPSWATLSDFQPAAVLFTWNWGTVCLLLAAALAATYLLRKVLKRRWMIAHRILTVALILSLVFHLTSMGIQLPQRLSETFSSSTEETVSSSASESAAASDSTTASGDSAAAGSTSSAAEDSTAAASNDTAAAGSDTAAASSGTSSDSASSSVATFSGAQLKDGTYEGSADGYGGTTTVSVTVSGGQVTNITVVSENDTDRFFSQAESVLDDITSQQSLEVDTVTGATFSSAGLINAVANALQSAVVSGTLQVTNIDLSSVERHGR